MHYVLPATWGPTDITRAALPFVFAHTALEAGDTVTMMLFHDAVHIALPGAHPAMVPFGPPARFAEVMAHPNATVLVCKPCAELRGITAERLAPGTRMGGMGDFHAAASRPDARVVTL